MKPLDEVLKEAKEMREQEQAIKDKLHKELVNVIDDSEYTSLTIPEIKDVMEDVLKLIK